MHTSGITELLTELMTSCSEIQSTTLNFMNCDTHKNDFHKDLSNIVCIIDFLIESGVVDSKILQNHKIYSRIRFNETRKHMTDRVVVIPNFQPVPSKWEQ